MTPDNLQQRYQQALAALDAQLARLNRELSTLAVARPADPDVIAAAVARAQQASEAVGSLVGAAADAVGEPPPVWGTRDELDATVRRLTERLRAAAVERRRARLRAVAGALLAAQVIHPRWRKVVPALDSLRLRAADQVREAADAADPPELPGPADGTAWLAWAWNLTPEQVEDALAGVRKSVPALAEVVLEIDPGHWFAQALPDAPLEPAASPVGSSRSDSILPDQVPMGVPVAEVVADPLESAVVPPSDAWVEEEPELESAPPAPPARPKVVVKPVVVAPPAVGSPDATGANAEPPGPAAR
jgi:hypothetical protein